MYTTGPGHAAGAGRRRGAPPPAGEPSTLCTYIYIYIYREREREYKYIYIYIYIYIQNLILQNLTLQKTLEDPVRCSSRAFDSLLESKVLQNKVFRS